MLYKGHYAMLNNKQLQNSIDSLSRKLNEKETLINNKILDNYNYNPKITYDYFENNNINNKKKIFTRAINKLRVLKSVSQSNANDINYKKMIIAKHKIEWHRKLSLSIACIVMFLIGAPLGSIVRKGGFSVPLLISILLFVIYYVISISGEKTAKDLSISPFEGMWIANLVFLPISIFLIYHALNNTRLPNIINFIKLKQ